MRDRLFVHVVWTTRDRAALIDGKTADFLVRFLPAIARQERARIMELGIVRTHVHALIRLHPTTSIPRLLQRLKGGSGVIANREGHSGVRDLKWAKGYSIDSVSYRSIAAVRSYIKDQPARHPAEAIWVGRGTRRLSDS